MRPGLLIVDIQNDYFAGGKMALNGMQAAAGNAARGLQAFRERKLPVFHIRHISKHPGSTFFLEGTHGAEIHPTVAPRAEEAIVEKNFPNSFRDTSLLTHLEDARIETVVICGAMSHMCIDATTRAAFDLGLDCIVIEDACATRDLEYKGNTVKATEVHAAFMAALAAVYARVIPACELASLIG